jgi:hypothetical protein
MNRKVTGLVIRSHNGWPASKNRAEIGVKSFVVPDTEVKLACAESVAPLLINFAREFHHRVEIIDKGTPDDWGYAFRTIRGSDVHVSNHASGTAIDINATKHPLGKRGTFTKRQEKVIRELCTKYGLRWGGDYQVRADEMHFEVVLNPEKSENLIKSLRDGLEI